MERILTLDEFIKRNNLILLFVDSFLLILYTLFMRVLIMYDKNSEYFIIGLVLFLFFTCYWFFLWDIRFKFKVTNKLRLIYVISYKKYRIEKESKNRLLKNKENLLKELLN